MTDTTEQPTTLASKSLDQQFAEWLAVHNATIAVVAVAPVTKERVGLINLLALNWPIEVVIVPKQEQTQ